MDNNGNEQGGVAETEERTTKRGTIQSSNMNSRSGDEES